MSVQPRDRTPDAPARARELPDVRRDRLSEVARRVREDAQHDPTRTLKDAEVPAGGE